MLFKRKWPDQVILTIDEKPVRVKLRQHARARNYRLTLPSDGRPVLTVPPKGRLSEAEAFLNRQKQWLGSRLNQIDGPQPFTHAAIFPVRGVDHTIIGQDKLRGAITLQVLEGANQISVPGGPDHLSRRLKDWLKKEALSDLKPRVAFHAERLGVTYKSITIRSQSSRWGSCSSAGRLNFNWRLILAPPYVLDYVAAHEVAHLVEMNHSDAFWAQVSLTLPDMERGRQWLKIHGRQLMSYGLEDA